MNKKDDLNFVGKKEDIQEFMESDELKNISPNDAKYRKASEPLQKYLSAHAEWMACAYVQKVLLETRVEFGQAEQKNLDEMNAAMDKISPLSMAEIEANITKHDQLAVLEEIGKYVSKETKALLHPGTTSYDILDTARAFLFKNAWKKVIRPKVAEGIEKLCVLGEKSMDFIQAGRTHLQTTSPVPMGATFSLYAKRMAERVDLCDQYFDNLKGKISGIVGTGASIEMVVGEGKALEFEAKALQKLGLKPDYTATQIVQKENLADVGHGLTTLMHVLGDFSNDIRLLYSSAIQEVTSRDNAERLGGSSADATKNNPINYENICGKVVVVESGMRTLYAMIQSDLQRDLRNSVMGRYQPQQMMAETYEAFSRFSRALDQLSINEDKLYENLKPVMENPSEAMVAILRGVGFTHSKYGTGHDFVKEMGKKSKSMNRRPIFDIALDDKEFSEVFHTKLSQEAKDILSKGKLENYLGPSKIKAYQNIYQARQIIGAK